jgi:hypothetical protein
MAKIDKLLEKLQMGWMPCPGRISRFLGMKRPHDAIYKLRQEGYAIYSNRWYRTDGRLGGVTYKLAPSTFGSNHSRFGQHQLNGRRRKAIKSLYSKSV